MKKFEIAKKAARQAGRLLMERFGRLGEVRYKSRRDPVSEADKGSEALIAGIIGSAFPDDGFLAEEETRWEPARGSGRWIVDPLDGTVNYAHGYPCFCVSIAYEIGGEVTLAVVHDPANRETYTAVRGRGAQLNGRPISVSKTRSLIKALVVTGFPYDTGERPGRIFPRFREMAKAAEGVRRDGSAALDLCYVAAGRLDGFWEERLKPWDTAAGALIAAEAGAKVTDFSGREFRPQMGEILAANGRIHKQMMGVLG